MVIDRFRNGMAVAERPAAIDAALFCGCEKNVVLQFKYQPLRLKAEIDRFLTAVGAA